METGTDAGAQDAGGHDLKGEHIVDDIEPAASSTLTKVERTAMSTLVKKMISLCSTYDIGFKSSAKKHDLSIREVLSGKISFVLADSLYNVRRVLKVYHAKYDVFSSTILRTWTRFWEK